MRKKEFLIKLSDAIRAFCEDGTWLERQGTYSLTLAEAKQRAVDILESVPTQLQINEKAEIEKEQITKTETQNSKWTFEKVQTQVIEFPDTHQKFIFARKIETDSDSIKIGNWEYKRVKDGEREGE